MVEKNVEMVADWVRERRERYGAAFVSEFENWLRDCQGQGDSIVIECMRLLDETYLLSLPLPRGVVLPQVLGPRNFRFLFRRNVAALLRWTERRSEGESRGFSDSINNFVREIWWPDSEAEALHNLPPQPRGDRLMEPSNLPGGDRSVEQSSLVSHLSF